MIDRRIFAPMIALLLAAIACGTAAPPTEALPTLAATAAPSVTPVVLPTLLPTPTPSITEPAATTPPEEAPTATSEIPPLFASLSPGWTKFTPGGDTRCAQGEEYAFWVRPGRPEKLMILFDGGGACWDYDTCSLRSAWYFESVGNSPMDLYAAGILDFDNPENPFLDYSMLFIPTCTADFHWGDNRQTYTATSGETIDIYHNGFINASTVLSWADENLPTPENIFLTGCSAGSIGSAAFAPYIIEQYPQTRIAQMGDSFMGVFHQPFAWENTHASDKFPDWIPQLDPYRNVPFTMAQYYSAIANYYPNYTFAQSTYAFDWVQVEYYLRRGGDPARFGNDLQAHLSEISANAPNYRAYVAAGDRHCIIPFAEFYTVETNGVRLTDWMADLAAGIPVSNVYCESCE